jgi:peptide-methionine (R)-S-oxide reductase
MTPDHPPATDKSEEQWKALLRDKGAEPVAFEVTRHAATERPFTGKYADHWKDGIYHCICCDKALFKADSKFDAGCGWPSFDQAIADGAVATRVDRTHGMVRTEALCPGCGAHLGHVFDDGPTDTGLRYCMNSASLHFSPS